jgi:hypothetical protein
MTDDFDEDYAVTVPDWLVVQIILNIFVYSVALLSLGSGLFKTIVVVAISSALVYADYGRRFLINLGAILLMLNIFGWIGADVEIREYLSKLLK